MAVPLQLLKDPYLLMTYSLLEVKGLDRFKQIARSRRSGIIIIPHTRYSVRHRRKYMLDGLEHQSKQSLGFSHRLASV